jgi:catechol 2,3-dioxygenase-like lactoylglutathione lyase family enzyme
MFSHIMIGSNDIARSKKFYDALFTAMGARQPQKTPGADSLIRTMAAVSW